MAVETEPKAQTFTLKTPLLAKGATNNVVVDSDLLWIWVKVYAEGGENFLHKHVTEDHAFIVLDGQATFHDQHDNLTVLNKHDGIFMPRGTFYSFTSTGDGPLVLLRAGAGKDGTGYSENREWFPGVVDTRVASGDRPVEIPGKFFGDPADAQ
jgi:mannose-6-phosphate isomerase-like protein (cupin superfamily)